MTENDHTTRKTVRSRLLFHLCGYALTLLLAIPAFYLGIARDDWDRDYRITLCIGGAGLAFGGTMVLLGILFRLRKERREGPDV